VNKGKPKQTRDDNKLHNTMKACLRNLGNNQDVISRSNLGNFGNIQDVIFGSNLWCCMQPTGTMLVMNAIAAPFHLVRATVTLLTELQTSQLMRDTTYGSHPNRQYISQRRVFQLLANTTMYWPVAHETNVAR
jgi:hypothetical protein